MNVGNDLPSIGLEFNILKNEFIYSLDYIGHDILAAIIFNDPSQNQLGIMMGKYKGEKSDIVIEHWGINENEMDGSTPVDWSKSWDEYRDEMDIKRQYWKTYNLNKPFEQVTLIETSIADMTDRDHFEAILKGRLNEHGIEVNKLSDDKLFSKLERLQVARITNMFKITVTM